MKIIIQNIKHNLSPLQLYTLNFVHGFFNLYIIYTYIITDYNVKKIVNLFAIEGVALVLSILISGYILDVLGRKKILMLINFLSILTSLSLLLAIKNPIFIYLYAIISPVPRGFLHGKNEAIMYQNALNMQKIQIFPRNLATLYLIINSVEAFSIFITAKIVNCDSMSLINLILVITVALKIMLFPILAGMKNLPQYTKKYTPKEYIKTTLGVILKTGVNKKIILFAIYTSYMYIYREIIIITGKIYNLEYSVITSTKLFYNIGLMLGCLIPIVISPRVVQKYREFITYYIPLLLTALMIFFNLIEMPYAILAIICIMSISFCSFEACIDLAIDRSAIPTVLGGVNSITWALSAGIGAVFSLVIMNFTHLFSPYTALNITIGAYLLAILCLKNK